MVIRYVHMHVITDNGMRGETYIFTARPCRMISHWSGQHWCRCWLHDYHNSPWFPTGRSSLFNQIPVGTSWIKGRRGSKHNSAEWMKFFGIPLILGYTEARSDRAVVRFSSALGYRIVCVWGWWQSWLVYAAVAALTWILCLGDCSSWSNTWTESSGGSPSFFYPRW
jgi:hypothetical protein